jgi:hypothetical protein
MLDRSAKELLADGDICLPLAEGKMHPNLKRIVQVAVDTGAIPVFAQDLPNGGGISAICDSTLELPTGPGTPAAPAKERWAELLSTCIDNPKSSLTVFGKNMDALLSQETKDRIRVRVYMLRFQAGAESVPHPAIVVLSP